MTAATATDPRADANYFETKIRNISDEELFASFQGISDLKAWSSHWRESRKRLLFYDAEEFLAGRDEAKRSFEPTRDQVVNKAARILAHDITGWGDVRIAHGPVVDFNADYGKAGQYGFHFWDWCRPLIQAFLLTENLKYLSEFERLFNQWYEQRENVKGRITSLDVIWYELGLGRRSRFFLEYYALRHEARSITTHGRMLKSLLGAARWLYEEQKLGNRLGNWQIMGAYGLGLIALTVPEFRESDQWLSLVVDLLAWHLENDFYPDGCHWERCPSSYMLVAYRDIHNFATMLSRGGYAEQAARLSDPLKRSLGFYHSILPPDQIIPAINDGGRSPIPARIGAEMRALHPGPAGSAQLPSGFTVLRSGQHEMLINHGPSAGGHTHFAALTFELHAFGRPMAIDSGIGLTYDDPNYETWYRRANAHNMLTLGDADPERKVTAGCDARCISNERFDYFAATHHGYEASHGILHRRHFLFVKPDYFLIYDAVQSRDVPSAPGHGRDAHDTNRHPLIWHLHSPLRFERGQGGFIATEDPGLLVAPSSEQWSASQATGLASVRGIPGFEVDLAPIRWLRFEGTTSMNQPAQFAVLLYPFRGNPPHVEFQATFAGDEAQFAITRDGQTEHVVVDPSPAEGPGIRISTETT